MPTITRPIASALVVVALSAAAADGESTHWRKALELAIEEEPTDIVVSVEKSQAAWSRANSWVARNHWTKIQHSDDYSIQTFTDSSGNTLLVSREDLDDGVLISVSGMRGWQPASLARFIRTADPDCRDLKHQEKWNNNSEYRSCLLECETEKKGCVPKVSLEQVPVQESAQFIRIEHDTKWRDSLTAG